MVTGEWAKIVAGDDMFVDHYRVTMMDSEPPTNGRGGWIHTRTGIP